MFATNKRALGALITKLSVAMFAAAALAFTSTSRSLASPGDLYVTDLATGSIVVYALDGTPSTFATGLTSPQGITFDQLKNLYVADAGDGAAGNGTIFKYDIITKVRITVISGLDNPIGMTVDGSSLLVSENGLDRVLRVPLNPDGTQGGPTTVFKLITGPLGLISQGININNVPNFFRYIANGPSVIQVAPDTTTTDIDPGDTSRSVVVDPLGNAFVSSGAGTRHVTKIPLDGLPNPTFAEGFTLPTGMDFRPARFSGDTDRVGFLYVADMNVADTTAGIIYQISPAAVKTPFVTGAGQPNYIAFEVFTKPVVVTGIASDITDVTATLNGTVNPEGGATTYQFEYGLTTAYGSTTPQTSAGSGFTAVPVSAAITGLTPGAVYHFRITATNGGGTVNGADSTFTASSGQPTPAPIVVTGAASNITDTTATLNGTVNPSGSATTYHFEYGVTTAYGSNTPSTSAGSGFTAVPVSAALTGLTVGTVYHFRVTATNVGGTANGADATFTTTTPSPTGKLLNISTRVDVKTGNDVGIGGFIITAGTLPKNVAVRAIGPSLAVPPFSLAGTLADPILELHEPDGTVVTNNNWKDNSAADQATIVSNGLDKFGGNPISDSESIILATLPPKDPAVPGSGEYTAVISGVGGGVGIGLVEVYDLDDPSAVAQLANISTRGLVGTDANVMIGGVIIGPIGGPDASVVVRAIGPSLPATITDPLADPFLDLRNGNGDPIFTNDNWQDDPTMAAEVTAVGLAPTDVNESAIFATLPASNYTAIVTGVGGTTGVGLVEIYHVPTPAAGSPSH